MEPRDPMAHEALLELAELAPLQGLEPEEHRRLAEHLEAGCEECEVRYAEGLRALDVLADAAPDVDPSPALREALLTSVAPAREERRSQGGGWRVAFPALAAGVALAVAVGSLYTALRIEHDARETLREARAQLDAQIEAKLARDDTRLEDLAARLARFESALETKGGTLRVRELPLGGTSDSVTATARAVVDTEAHQVLLLASRLPPAPPGHTYQLWVIESGAPAPRSAGVFDPDAGGRVLHVETAPGDLEREFQVAVSVEPSGGMPQPTGPIVLASH